MPQTLEHKGLWGTFRYPHHNKSSILYYIMEVKYSLNIGMNYINLSAHWTDSGFPEVVKWCSVTCLCIFSSIWNCIISSYAPAESVSPEIGWWSRSEVKPSWYWNMGTSGSSFANYRSNVYFSLAPSLTCRKVWGAFSYLRCSWSPMESLQCILVHCVSIGSSIQSTVTCVRLWSIGTLSLEAWVEFVLWGGFEFLGCMSRIC
jgi:hypothetical protein